jgi:hypothetical protein
VARDHERDHPSNVHRLLNLPTTAIPRKDTP